MSTITLASMKIFLRSTTSVHFQRNINQKSFLPLIEKHGDVRSISAIRGRSRRYFSDEPSSNSNDKTKKEESNHQKDDDNDVSDAIPDEVSKIKELENQIKETKDQLLRSLAEQENIRRIAKRDVENARSFAVASFAKSLLDTSDNLTRAMDAVPKAYRSDKEKHPVLATLYEGIQMIDDGLMKAFNRNGLTKYGSVGEKFDPNLHDALFEYPDPNMESGYIGQVMKPGFKLNDRVIRPAEVGVIKK
jgi:molecular chaperone GrpE